MEGSRRRESLRALSELRCNRRLRRRNDVLNTRREAHTLPYEASPEMADDDEPTFRPMRAIDAIRQRDDVDEALQRFARRRRAAAVS